MIASGGREDSTALPMDGWDDEEDAGVVGSESEANEWRRSSAGGECGDGASIRNSGRSGNNAGALYQISNS